MRVLILGGDGMLGHQLFKRLRPRHDVRVTLRKGLEAYGTYNVFDPGKTYGGVDVRTLERLEGVMTEFRPEAVVNCVGIVKQRDAASDSIASLEINSLFPHKLALLCKRLDARMIHFSTDCVFSGKKGNYKESDTSDAEDLYGRTKYLGEVFEPRCITLRTSIIGRELTRKQGLLEWFLSQKGPIRGFRKAIFSGFTTLEMGRIVEGLLVEYPKASGVYHVSSDPISKYDLLVLIKEKMALSVTIEPDDAYQCDRSLDSSRFRMEFQYSPPAWEEMVGELVSDMKKEEKP